MKAKCSLKPLVAEKTFGIVAYKMFLQPHGFFLPLPFSESSPDKEDDIERMPVRWTS